MKIIHFGGGLGNQLADYFNYLTVLLSNNEDEIYIETLVYDIVEAGQVVSSWNGYKLEKVFGIKLPNIKEKFSEKEWEMVIEELRETKFWEKGWQPRNKILEILNKHGCKLEVIGSLDYDKNMSIKKTIKNKISNYLTQQSNNLISFYIKYLILSIRSYFIIDKGNSLYVKREGNQYYPPTFSGIKSKKLINIIGPEFRKNLQFKQLNDRRNLDLLKIINDNNSVSIHARRTDYLKYNNDCYKYGYFKRAVKYIKKKVKNPIFIIFSEDCEWCKSNLKILGINQDKDIYYFVDWNKESKSYIDLQLMAQCKHNIITKSSFGYIACLLNNNPNKITCSQVGDYITTVHF